ncbi:MAG TPA: ABC transporter permease, partial [Thermoanaerobaculia bacterium]
AREIVGVMPRGFAFPNAKADLYLPRQLDPARTSEEGRYLTTFARLRPGVSIAAAQADMKRIAAMTAREQPEMNTGWGATAQPIMEYVVGKVRRILWVLFAAVGLLLLIACVNVANLLFLRAAGRRREINVRLALGAGRWRIVHQLIVESVLLSLLGGLAGLALAQWGLSATLGLLPADFPLPRLEEIRLDPSVFAFATAISLATGLLFGLAPAWQSSGGDVAEQLREGSRSVAGGGRRLRRLLVVSEIAVALLLVIGAGLMVRSFLQLNAVDPGFRAERVLTWKMLLPRMENEEERVAYMDQVLNEVRSLSGVVSASSILWLPLSGEDSGSLFYRADVPEPPPSERTGGDISVVSTGYFATMGIPRLAGRDFDAHDRPGAPQVAILNQSAVRMLYPHENPIGKRLKISWDGDPEAEVVGVVADSRHDGLNVPPEPTLFLPTSQRPPSSTAVVLRADGDPQAMVPAVRAALRRVNPNQAISQVQTMEDVMAGSIARQRLQAVLLGAFACLALLLACIGIYGLISYSVAQRTHEIGIRLALGAAPRAVRNLLFREGLGLAGLGVVLGLFGSVLLSRSLESLLFEVKARDPMVYSGVVALLLASAALACYIPARRAEQVDPQVVLRDA